MKRRVRGLANNKSKWQILDNGDVLSTPPFRLSYHVFKTNEVILKKVYYIKSSDLARLYSDINNRQHFNDLNDEIILNHTYDEKDFAMIKSFKKEQLPAICVSTDEDYRHVEHLYTKSKLMFKEIDELCDKCTYGDIRFDMSRINSWYIKRRSELTETKTAKKKQKQEEKKIM